MTPTIFTLTGNLLWEHTLEFANWSPGKTQRAIAQSSQVGGKGINVSRMLVRLGTPTEALCFASGSTGADCIGWMQDKGIPAKAFPSKLPTRIGAVIRANSQPETTFLGPDVSPDADACNACAEYLRRLPTGSVLALCGSFPGWLSAEAAPLREAVSTFALHSALIVDSYGPLLGWARSQPAALIKINRDEFAALDAEKPTSALATRLASTTDRFQPRAWIVTDGAEPVWISQKNNPPRSIVPPRIKMVSPTGSGDVLLACFVHAHFHLGLAMDDALQFALPYASANAGHSGIADFDLNNLPT